MTNSTITAKDGISAATNSIVEPTQSQGRESPDSSLSWVSPAVAILVVGIAVVVYRRLRRERARFKASLESELIEDILKAVAGDVTDKAPLRTEIGKVLSGDAVFSTEPLSSILRVEETYAKLKSGGYLRRVSILRRKAKTSGTLTKVENEVGWEYVPDAVRAKFIETRENQVVRLVYDANGGNAQ